MPEDWILPEYKIYKNIDATSENCAGPIGELSSAMNDAYPGEAVSIVIADEATRDDILIWASRTGNEVVGNESDDGRFTLTLKKVK